MASRLVPLAALAFLLGGWVSSGAAQGDQQVSPAGQSFKSPSKNERGDGSPVTGSLPHRRDQRYHVRPGDVIELTFPFSPEFNQIVTVQPDGYITLRGLGDLPAEGQTAPGLALAVRTAYSKILHDPVVTVDLKDFEKPYFVVGGEVGHPGKFDLRSDTTVTQAVAIAGGFRETSKHSQVLLIRKVSDEWAEVKVLNLKKMLQTADLREDSHLRPGDMLYVPKNILSKVKPFIPIPGIGAYFNPTQF